jgi:flagellar motility protein MotE (MotC chaperone)
MRIEELTNSIIALETENKNLNHDIEELHYSHEDEKRVHDDELAKVKNKIKEIEAAHASNLKSLEEEYRSQGSQGKGANVTTSRMKSGDL